GFAGSLMAKDLGLARHAIETTGAQAPMGLHAEEIYAEFASGEGATKDFSGIINTLRT
ncbi:MAG TPA: NAD-binding protein, partial [Actinomyces sp.]|nr:NAD-binding protein [Actinomyces sp.]